jgi:hypothetical protein
MKRFYLVVYALAILFLAISCKKEINEPLIYDSKEHRYKSDFEPVKYPKKDPTYHTDTSFKYEYRTGDSGNYQYHYDVIGHKSSGEKVLGFVDMEGKYGKGTLADSIPVDAEWVGYGKIEAHDAKGKVYELIVE